MNLTRFAPLLSVLVFSGCGGVSRSSDTPIGTTDLIELSEREDEEVESVARPPADVVRNAALPFKGKVVHSGQELDHETFLTHLAAADAVCIGERHDRVLDHYAELAVTRGLLERREMRGFALGIALEMVKTEFQLALTAFADSRLGLPEFEVRSRFDAEWGYPIEFYAPLLDEAALSKSSLVALGVDRDFTRRVAEVGISGLTGEEASRLPEFGPPDPRHREIFDALMSGHPGHERRAEADDERGSESGGDRSTRGRSATDTARKHGHAAKSRSEADTAVGAHDGQEVMDRFYDAQLVWDESMAQGSAKFLSERAPSGKLLIIAGAGHCHRSAIPARIRRRGDFQVISVLPVSDGAPAPSGDAADRASTSSVTGAESEKVEALLRESYDYHLVFESP